MMQPTADDRELDEHEVEDEDSELETEEEEEEEEAQPEAAPAPRAQKGAGQPFDFAQPSEMPKKPRTRRPRAPRPPSPDRRHGTVPKFNFASTDVEELWPEVIQRLAAEGKGPEELCIRVRRIAPGEAVTLRPPIEGHAVAGDVSTSPADALQTYVEDFYHGRTSPNGGPAVYSLEFYWRNNGTVFAKGRLKCPSVDDINRIRQGLMERGAAGMGQPLHPMPRDPRYQPQQPPPYGYPMQPGPYGYPMQPMPYGYPMQPAYAPSAPAGRAPAPSGTDARELAALREQLRVEQMRRMVAEERAAIGVGGPAAPPPPAAAPAPTLEQVLVNISERLDRIERGERPPQASASPGVGAPPPQAVANELRTGVRAFGDMARTFHEMREVADAMHGFFYPQQQQQPAPAPGAGQPAAEEEEEATPAAPPQEDIVITDLGTGQDGRRRQMVRDARTGEVRLSETLMANDWLIELGMKHLGGTAELVAKRMLNGQPPPAAVGTGAAPDPRLTEETPRAQEQAPQQPAATAPAAAKDDDWSFG